MPPEGKTRPDGVFFYTVSAYPMKEKCQNAKNQPKYLPILRNLKETSRKTARIRENPPGRIRKMYTLYGYSVF